MKIGFITAEYPLDIFKTKYGGIGTFVRQIGLTLTKNGHEVFVFVLNADKELEINDNKIRVITLTPDKKPILKWFFNKKKYQKLISEYIKKYSIEVLEAPDWGGLTALMDFSIPLIIRLHGSDAFFCKLEGRKQKLKNYFFEKTVLNNNDGIIAVSQFVADETKKIFKISKRINVIYNGINTTLFSPLNKDEKKNSILYFGTLIRKKGFIELAHIFNEIVNINPKVRLKVAGKDVIDIRTKKSTYQIFHDKLSAHAKGQVEYLGNVPYKNISKIISEASVIVFPSFAEAFPLSWLEAMAMEKAIVASNIGWAREMIRDDYEGYLVHPQNHKLFAEKVVYLLNNKEKRNELGKNARKKVLDQFDIRISAKQSIEYYKKILRNT